MNHASKLLKTALFVLLGVAAATSACSRRSEPATPAPKSAKADEHNHDQGHDHGDEHDHDHGEAAHSDEVTLTAAAIEQYGVKVEPAELRLLQPTILTPARVAFNTEAMAHVGSPLRGRAIEVKVRLGDTVKAGQALVVVESPELGEAQADFLLRQSAVLTATPAAELSKIAWERARELYERSQGISLTDVQRREAEFKAAIANVKATEAAAIAAKNRLNLLGMDGVAVDALAKTSEIIPRYSIRSAIDGLVVQREVTPGEIISPDRESLMVVADTRSLWVLADVPEAKLAGVDRGTKAWVTIGSSSDPSNPAPRFDGIVTFVSPIVDPLTRSAQVRIEVPNSAEHGLMLRPGMFAVAEILQQASGTKPVPVIAIPDEAIQTVEGGPAIFVPVDGEPNTFAKRAVTVGKPVGGWVPILSGLSEGQPFVVTGTFILKAELGKAGAAHEH